MIPHDDGIGGDIFIRMELLTSLQQKMRERNLSEQEIIRLGKDISHALVLCKSKNIIHRDIKPANIMVSQFGNYKLGDFGVSKIMDHATYATPMGTPEYEAPEIKHMEKYGQAVDIYSLGITLYWLLNNRKMPFIGADEQITPARRSEAMEKRYAGKEKLPKPKNGSKRLKEIVLKACEYDPANRYASAQEMYDALDALGNEKPTVYPIPVKKPENPDDGGNGSVTVGRNGVSGSESDRNGGGQTQGNSWVENGGTIGKPGGSSRQNKDKDKGYSEVTDPGTVGVKDAYKKQKKKAEEKKEVVAEERNKTKKNDLNAFGVIWCLIAAGAMVYFSRLSDASTPIKVICPFAVCAELIVIIAFNFVADMSESISYLVMIGVVLKYIADWCVIFTAICYLPIWEQMPSASGLIQFVMIVGVVVPTYLTYKINALGMKKK